MAPQILPYILASISNIFILLSLISKPSKDMFIFFLFLSPFERGRYSPVSLKSKKHTLHKNKT